MEAEALKQLLERQATSPSSPAQFVRKCRDLVNPEWEIAIATCELYSSSECLRSSCSKCVSYTSRGFVVRDQLSRDPGGVGNGRKGRFCVLGRSDARWRN